MGRLKRILHNPYTLFHYLRKYVNLNFLSDKTYISLCYRASFGKRIDWKNPKTFNEKLQWLKLYDRKPIYTTMVDKFAVKKYVADLIGEEYVIPTLGVWDSFDEIDFDALPNQFVLKCTHDSGGLVICKDKSAFDYDSAKKKINASLKRNYYWQSREWVYKDVKPRIIAENYMEDSTAQDLKDYKFLCFSGVPKIMYVVSDFRGKGEKYNIDYFDEKFNHLNIRKGEYPNSSAFITEPKGFQKMKDLASILSKDVSQLRVDFYEVDGEIFFGELTFYDYGGSVPFKPAKWDSIMGDWIHLPMN